MFHLLIKKSWINICYSLCTSFTESVMVKKHGGKRKNSGCKPKIQPQQKQTQTKKKRDVASFFSNRLNQSQDTSSTSSNVSNLPWHTLLNNVTTTSTVTAQVIDLHGDDDTISVSVEEVNNNSNQHNSDADYLIFDDSIFIHGQKTLNECHFLLSQREYIMSHEYKRKSFVNVEKMVSAGIWFLQS